MRLSWKKNPKPNECLNFVDTNSTHLFKHRVFINFQFSISFHQCAASLHLFYTGSLWCLTKSEKSLGPVSQFLQLLFTPQMLAALCFTNHCSSQITDKFTDPTGLLRAYCFYKWKASQWTKTLCFPKSHCAFGKFSETCPRLIFSVRGQQWDHWMKMS